MPDLSFIAVGDPRRDETAARATKRVYHKIEFAQHFTNRLVSDFPMPSGILASENIARQYADDMSTVEAASFENLVILDWVVVDPAERWG